MEVLRQNFYDIPIITRFYTTACVMTALCVHLELVSPLQLYFNPRLIISNLQIWRLATTFLYFGPVGFSFFFNIIFTYRYCRMLEEGSFRGRTSDFLVMILFGSILMILLAICVNLVLLGQAFTIMLVYIWSRRNTFIRLNFFGLLNFQAPYLPWVLLCFSMILGNTVWVDLVGMSVGHMYYFLEDVLPCQRGGCKLLKTPRFLKLIFNELPNVSYVRPVANQPGGFNWGPQNMINLVRAAPEEVQEGGNEE